jgi:hypothetical protein
MDTQYGYGPTKITQLYICLTGLVHFGSCTEQPDITGPIPAAMLAAIDAGLASFARSGVRLLIRFDYAFSFTNGRDAPIALISTHIDQLAPILLKYRDLIFALQAGFIGEWGEWHDSTNGNDNAAAHKVILDKELSYFKGAFPVLVRYPQAMINYAGGLTPADGLGIHDDYLATTEDDGGTWSPSFPPSGESVNYTQSQLMDYGQQISTTNMLMGELGDSYPSRQSCAALDAYFYKFHLQALSLHIDAKPALADLLVSEGCIPSLLNKAGTRIELQKAVLIGNSSANSSMSVALTMVNAGYGRVMRERPVTLVFLSNGAVVGQVPVSLQDLDLRQLVASSAMTPKTFQFTVTLPASLPPGRAVTVALAIPDPAPSLTPQAVYNLPLNSLDANGRAIFDSTTGYNTIGAFTVGATGQGALARPIKAITAQSPVELTGTWSGENATSAAAGPYTLMPLAVLPQSIREAVARLQGTPRITWSLAQTGATVAGTAGVTLQGTTVLSGRLAGTLANNALTYMVSVPAGAVSIAPTCAGQIEGLVNLTATQLVGSASVRTSTCPVPLPSVTFTLTKQ